MATRQELDRELDKGGLDELPPNVPPGFLGEAGPDMRAPETFRPSLNAGVLQESTYETRWLSIILAYLLVVGAPVAFFLLWRDTRRALRVKVIATVVMVLGYVALFFYVRSAG